jgi:tRNA A37 methylthiotransferase MiaB
LCKQKNYFTVENTILKMSDNNFRSIMRGCDNMCSYCIVPFTRGKERSRPLVSIENEVKALAEQGVKEITLLGQNVNSYRYLTPEADTTGLTSLAPGFKTVYKTKVGGVRFGELLSRVAEAVPEVRIRFTSPHPKDFPDEVIPIYYIYFWGQNWKNQII